MSDGSSLWDGGFTDGSGESWYGSGADTGTSGAEGARHDDSIVILPNGDVRAGYAESGNVGEGSTPGTGIASAEGTNEVLQWDSGGIDQADGDTGYGQDVFTFSGDVLGIASAAQAEMAELMVSSDEGVGEVDNEVLPAEESEGGAMPTPSPAPTVTPDPVLGEIYGVVLQISERQDQVDIHYHNMELIGMTVIALLAMGFGGMVAYGFLRRIFI